VARHAKRQPRHIGQVLALFEFGDAINVAADEMPAEFIAQPQRPFEIELCPRPPGAGGSQAQGFGRGIDGEKGTVTGAAPRYDREADAGAGNGRPNVDLFGVIAADNGQPAQALGLLFTSKTSPKSLIMPVNIRSYPQKDFAPAGADGFGLDLLEPLRQERQRLQFEAVDPLRADGFGTME
jgi:hypothetical protein